MFVVVVVGAFNTFTFKVIINMYVPITIFLIIFHLCFLLREVPLVFVVNLFGGAEFFELLLICKAFDFFVKSELDPCWGEQSWL